MQTTGIYFLRAKKRLPIFLLGAFILILLTKLLAQTASDDSGAGKSAGTAGSVPASAPKIALGSKTGSPSGATGPASAPSSPAAQNPQSPNALPTIIVIGKLNQARQKIVSGLGATVYTIDQNEIQAQGNNVPVSKLALRFPGVSQFVNTSK